MCCERCAIARTVAEAKSLHVHTSGAKRFVIERMCERTISCESGGRLSSSSTTTSLRLPLSLPASEISRSCVASAYGDSLEDALNSVTLYVMFVAMSLDVCVLPTPGGPRMTTALPVGRDESQRLYVSHEDELPYAIVGRDCAIECTGLT